MMIRYGGQKIAAENHASISTYEDVFDAKPDGVIICTGK
jgi:hypothetical protein